MADNIMGQVMGEIGSNVQPKDNPNPFAPPQDAEAQVAQNSMPNPAQARPMAPAPAPSPDQGQMPTPQATPTPQSSPAPQSDDDEKTQRDINSLFSEMEEKNKPKNVKDLFDQHDKVSALFQGIEQARTDNVDPNAPIIEPKKPGESAWDWASKAIPQQLKFVGAQMRAHLGRDPVEQRQAWESMFGADNVKTVGKDLYFRPDGSSKFRKIDQTLYNSVTDFVLFHALQVPGMLANGAGNVIGNLGADIATLNPVVGVAAGGALGGAANSTVDKGMISLLNAFSAKSQDHASYVNETMKSMGFGAVGALIFTPLANAVTYPVRKYGGALIGAIDSGIEKYGPSWLSGTGINLTQPTAEEATMKAAGNTVSKLAQVRNAFQEFSNYFFPSKVPENQTAGEYFHNGLDEINQRLGQAVGMIKDEALSMADQTGKKVSMTQTLQNMKDILQTNGMKFESVSDPLTRQSMDSSGRAILDSFDTKGMKPEVAHYLNEVGKLYNSFADSEMSQGGTELKDTLSYIDRLNMLTKWGVGDSTKDKEAGAIIRNMFRQIYNGAATDRNAMLNDLYSNSDSPNALMWKKAFEKFGQSADAVTAFNAIAKSPEERAFFMQSLTQAPNADKLELIRRTKQMFGADSEQWNAFKGEYYNQLLNKFTSPVDGVLDTAGFAKALGNPKSDVLVSELFDDKERAILNRMLIEGNKVNKGLGLSDSSQESIKNGIGLLAKFTGGTKELVRMAFGMFGNKKEPIDYLMNRGFLEAAQKAETPALKARFYQAMEMTEGLVSKMNVADVPSPTERAQKKFVEKYVPYFSGNVNATLFNKFAEPYRPQNAPNPQPQQPTQGE